MYKFKIYKVVPHINSIWGADAKVSDWKYIPASYEFEREVFPVYSDIVLSVVKEKERKFYRWKFTGSLLFKDEDYDFINGLRLNSVERCKARYILVEQKQGNVWNEVWKGFFKVGQEKYKNCQVTFENFETFDRYSEILTKMELEYNMVTESGATVYIPIVTYEYDEQNIEYSLAGIPVEDDCPDLPPDVPLTLDDKWTLVSCNYPKGSIPTVMLSVETHYRRDWQWSPVQPDSEWEEPTPAVQHPYITGVSKWVRNYRGQDTPSYYVYFNVGTFHCDYLIELPDLAVGENKRGKYLNNVVTTLLGRIASLNDSFISQFFKGFPTIPNPVTGDNLNFYTSLVLYQKSDLKATSNPATMGMITLEDIERWMRVVFNSFWYIDDNENFVIEHQKFFDGRRSYTQDKQIGLIITEESAKNKTGFSYISQIIPRYEKFECMDRQDVAFNGVPIEFDSACATEDEDNINLEHTTENLTLDLRFMISNEDLVADDGFTILAIEAVTTPFLRFEPKFEDNLLTGENLPNGDLAYPNLQYNLFRYNGFLSEAYINNVLTDFESWKKYKVGEDISIKLCDLSEFDPYKLVQTDLGDGEVIEGSYELKTQMLTLKLKYDG